MAGNLINSYIFGEPPPSMDLLDGAIAWHVAGWADDPLWTPPADGGAVSSLRDGSGNGRTFTAPDGQPTFRASVAKLGGRAGIEFDGVNDHLATADFSSLAQPWSYVVVFAIDTLVDGTYIMNSGFGESAGLGMKTGPNRLFVYAGSVLDSGLTADADCHFGHVVANGATTKIASDGVEETGDAGIHAADRLNIGSFINTAHGAVTVGFDGLFGGDVTALGSDWTDFNANVAAYYGLTIA